jgi:pimeloyl-ACP methyl ester carboxylesterase
MPFFDYQGNRLAYTEYGEGPRACILLPGLLFSQRMHIPLARDLADRGNRVITLDPLGHGRSDRPDDMSLYGMTMFGEQVVGLMDHLGLDDAVVGGTSLGANITLEVAAVAPERVRGMVVEMPVLDNALLGCAIAFTPLMMMLTFGAPVMRLVARGASLVPPLPLLPDLLVDWVRQAPEPSAAVLQGLFFNRTAPHKTLRRTFQAPTLILGHHRDPVHPFSDADCLAAELPNARLVEAGSFFEMRISPDRLTNEIGEFLDTCWKPKRATGTGAAGARAKRSA